MAYVVVGISDDFLEHKYGQLSDDELIRLEEQTKWDVAHLKRQLAEIKCEKERRLK